MLEENVIDRIVAHFGDREPDEASVAALRGIWPSIHFTFCFDDDVTGAEPVRKSEKFNVYLVDSSDHCLKFTADARKATGLVLAVVEDES